MTAYGMARAAAVLALCLGLAWFGLNAGSNLVEPGERGSSDTAYLDANTLFEDAQYDRATELYAKAVAQKADHLPALRGLANAHLQSRRLGPALAAVDRAVALEPDFGGNYAIRGIIHDHMGAYPKAIADYEKALALDPGLADGMSWLDRLLHNVQQRPATVADRLAYLKLQLSLPENERVLRRPAIDDKQRPYER